MSYLLMVEATVPTGCKMSVDTLPRDALDKLSKMLDNSTCGWRQLVSAAADQPQFLYSEKELTNCSLGVLTASGSPARTFLAWLSDRGCTVDFLIQCLKKINHQGAVEFLTSTIAEPIRIVVQPQSQEATPGSRVVLTCRASGPSGLNYQWFKGKEEISEETQCSPELVLFPLSQEHQAHYNCRINYGEKCLFSQWAQIRLLGYEGGSSMLANSDCGPQITQQPQSQLLSEGEQLELMCQIVDNPPVQYQWYHNNIPLPQQKDFLLKISCVTTEHRGEYRCKMFNSYHEVWSDIAAVTIGPSSVMDSAWTQVERGLESEEVPRSTFGMNPLQQTTNVSSSENSFYATDKVALLIGNMNYVYHRQLCAPMSDVNELTNLLRQMDFKVVSLIDLNCEEMHSAVTEFLLLLDKGVYGLLYFAGHGYENYGNSFMVPIDAPASYTSEHCLCVQSILRSMQKKQTGLNIFLMDMCRKRNLDDDVIVQPGLLKVTANIVFGYATCVDAEAYEVQRDDVSNGIFISFLKRRVCENEKVTVMLDRVAEDMGRCAITQGRQALELRSNLSERRSLTDPIRISDSSSSESVRNLQWAIAHDLPKSKWLQFECGVKVQLGFAAEFSNVMVIYTRILEKPADILTCSAQLTDFAEDVDVNLKKSNQDSLLEAGCLLVIREQLQSTPDPSLYTRICNLQRLRKELTFTVCLHYTYTSMDEEIQEKLLVSVGKPLVSKLNLYEQQSCCSSNAETMSLDSLSFSGDSARELVAVGLQTNTWQPRDVGTTPFNVPSSIGNVPEETDSPELVPHTSSICHQQNAAPFQT